MKKQVLTDSGSYYTDYPIVEIDIQDKSPLDWLDENRAIIINESVTAAEKILYDNIDQFVPIIKLTGNKLHNFVETKPNKSSFILLGLDKNDITNVIEKSMQWCIDTEEYELCHRIKLLQELIDNQSM
jgi:hypothetical protein